MKVLPIVLSAMLITSSGLVFARGGDCDCKGKRHHQKSEYMQNLTEEERAAFKAGKEKLKAMSDDERKAFKESTKSKWDALSKAEQDAFIAQHQDKIDKALSHKKDKMILRLYGMSQLNQQ